MIEAHKLIDKQWYDGFLWHDGRQKSVATLYWNETDALFKSDEDSRVYPHVAESRTARVYCFEPSIIGADPNGKSKTDARTPTKAS
jgi:hypothetical protein